MGILGLATLNCLWGVGSQSLLNDEAGTWVISSGPVDGLFHRVNLTEIVPPLYYLLLHGWLYMVGSQSEAALRLPSVLAALALVAAVGWLGTAVADRRVGTGAALLAAISPCTVIYAQQARAYMPTMLAVTVAVAAFVTASQRASQRGSGRWLAASALASGFAVAFHYTGWLVVLPLCAALVTSAGFAVREKVAYVGWCAFVGILNAPFLVTQLERGRADHQSAGLTWRNVANALGAPFGGRFPELWPVVAGAVVTVGALAIIAVGLRSENARREHGPLLLACAVTAPIVTLVLTAVGARVLWPRYVAVAVPFLFVVVALAVALQPGVFRQVALGAVAVAVAASGSILSHRSHYSYYGDLRGAVLTAERSWRPSDLLINGTGDPTLDATTRYYAYRFVPGGEGRAIPSNKPALAHALQGRARVWAITGPAPIAKLQRSVAGVGGDVTRLWRYRGAAVVQLILIEPTGGGASR